eukprot:gene6957-11119_t
MSNWNNPLLYGTDWTYLYYNIDYGMMDGWCHGLKNGFLKKEDYFSFNQCSNLDEMKTNMISTDYGNFLQNETNIRVDVIEEKATEFVAGIFNEFRFHATEPLATFLDFVTYPYMINNTLKMIQSVRSGKSALETYYKLHPLGYYSSIQSVSAVSSIDELYSIVLVDSPIGKFFTKTVKQDFEEFSMEFIKNLLYKNWIEAFYDYVQKLDDITRENMSRILEFEADQTVITITKNSFNLKTELPPDEKLSLYPKIGQLTDYHVELSKAADEEKLKELLTPYPEYAEMFQKSTQGEAITDLFAKRTVMLNKWSFDEQFHFGVFYSFLKLKEYEIKNLALVANCITLSTQEKINEKIIDLN